MFSFFVRINLIANQSNDWEVFKSCPLNISLISVEGLNFTVDDIGLARLLLAISANMNLF